MSGEPIDVHDLLGAIESDPGALSRLRALAAPARTLHSTATLAAELEVSERTIRRAIEAGELPATRRCGRWVIVADDACAWARSGRAPTIRARTSTLPPPRPRQGVLRAVASDLKAA